MNHPQASSENIGKVALFYHQSYLHFGFVSAEQDRKYQIQDTAGESISLNPARIVLLSMHTAVHSAEELSAFQQRASQASADFTSVSLQGESFELLCQRLELDSDERRFALYLHLKSHPECYYQKHDRFFLRSAEEQAAYRKAQDEASLRKQYLQELEHYLNSRTHATESFSLEPDNAIKLALELRIILQGGKVEDLEKLLLNYSQGSTVNALAIALRRSLHDAGDDPIFAASGLPRAFIGLAQTIELAAPELPLAEHSAFSIDDADTLDYDDAISLQEEPGGYRLGIHVSNLALYIDAQHPLFSEAIERVTSLYLPAEIVPMLPPRFSQDEFSLCEHQAKGVLTLYLKLNTELQVVDSELKVQRLRIERNLSYTEVDIDRKRPEYHILNRISSILRDQRDVAQDKERFYYTLKAQQGRVCIKRVDAQSPSRLMIEELMILYNRSIAQFAVQRNLPLLYRNINQFLDENQEVRNSSAFISTRPGYHPGIGAEAYLHATSPIRRVVDLINQMQVCGMLCQQQMLFSETDLIQMIPNIEKRILQIRETVSRSERYWFLKYIEQEQLHNPLGAYFKGYVNGKIKAEILPWGKQVLLDTAGKPEDEYFDLLVYAVDWEHKCLKADIIG